MTIEKRMALCREAIPNRSKWQADPVGKALEFREAHPPELVLALWECYQIALLFEEGQDAVARVEEICGSD